VCGNSTSGIKRVEKGVKVLVVKKFFYILCFFLLRKSVATQHEFDCNLIADVACFCVTNENVYQTFY
jgi:hypothetical protein